MKTSAISPADTSRTPINTPTASVCCSTTTDTTATTQGDVPRASGYIWLNCPSWYDASSPLKYAKCSTVDPMMYHQVPAGGRPCTSTITSPMTPVASAIHATPADRSTAPCAIAFQVACNTAAPSTTRTTTTALPSHEPSIGPDL